MRRILGLSITLAILISGVGASPASADGCLAVTGTTVTGIGTCSGDVVIPDGITSIGERAFFGATALTNITIPASVTTISEEAFFGASSLTTVTFEAGSQLTAIGSYAFYNAALTNMTIPASVTTINQGAFSFTSSLTSFDVDSSSTSFKDVDGVLFTKDGSTLISYPLGKTVPTYSIPANVTTIESGAFYNVTSLQTITFESGSILTSIGISAFGGASSLTSITIPAGVTAISQFAFGGASSLTSIAFEAGSNLTSIDSFAFYGATALTSISIPAGVTTIGMQAFNDASSLTTITFEAGSTLISIDDRAFENASSLASIIIPASVTAIGGRAFFNAGSLQTVTFEAGSNLTSIGDSAFMNASALTSIAIPASVAAIGPSTFLVTPSLTSINVSADNGVYKSVGGVLFTKDGTIILTYPSAKTGTSYTIPDGVTTIAYSAFFGATALTSITIPEGVTSIEDLAFRDTSLTSITIPASVSSLPRFSLDEIPALAIINVSPDNANYKSIDGVLFTKDGATILIYPREKSGSSYTIPNGVTAIGGHAFYFVESLASVTIPDSVIAIADFAFYGASLLRSVIFLGSPPAVGTLAFGEVSSCSSALVSAELQSAFTLVDGKWNGLKVNDECPVPSEPEEPVSPAPDGASEAAREALRIATENREAQKKQARSDLATISSESLTLDKFASAEIRGVTASNLAQVSAEIAALPAERRSLIEEIMKIARKFEVVDKVASGGRIDAAMLQEVGLIPHDSKNKTALVAALRKLPEAQRSSYALIQAAIATHIKKSQDRKDRLAALRARKGTRG